MKYVKIECPEIQYYMGNPEYNEECYFDPKKNCWFIPEDWDPNYLEGGEIGDLEDAMG